MLRRTLGAVLGLLLLGGGTATAATAATGGHEAQTAPLAAVQAPAAGEWQQAMERTNTYRALHQADPLTLDAAISADAQAWAAHLGRSGTFGNHPNSPYGQNICLTSGSFAAAAEKCVEAWYSEVSHYDFRRPGFSQATGHFTQLVWAASRRVGFGAATDVHGRTVVVAFYDPRGNDYRRFAENVRPPVN